MAEKLYEVDDIRHIKDIGKGNRFKSVVEITFTTTSGIVDTVQMLESDFNRASAKKFLTEKAQEIEDVIEGKG